MRSRSSRSGCSGSSSTRLSIIKVSTKSNLSSTHSSSGGSSTNRWFCIIKVAFQSNLSSSGSTYSTCGSYYSSTGFLFLFFFLLSIISDRMCFNPSFESRWRKLEVQSFQRFKERCFCKRFSILIYLIIFQLFLVIPLYFILTFDYSDTRIVYWKEHTSIPILKECHMFFIFWIKIKFLDEIVSLTFS